MKKEVQKAKVGGVARLGRGIIKASLFPLTGAGLKDIIAGARDIAREKSPEVDTKDDHEKRLQTLEALFAEIAAKEYSKNGLPSVQENIEETNE